jgi:hypothetical protein
MNLPRFRDDGGAFVYAVRGRRCIPREFFIRFYHSNS